MSQPEALPSPIAPTPAAPVVVTPILASKSSTIRLNKWTAIITGGLGLLATIVDLAVQAFADPTMVPVIQKFIPDMETRLIVMAIVGFLAGMNWKKRLGTTQPIIGTDAAAELPEATQENS